MRIEFEPGAVFKVPVGDGDHAYAVMLAAFPYVAFYHRDVEFDGNGVPVGQPMFTVLVARSAYRSGGWGKPVGRLPESGIPPIPRFFWQSVTDVNDCKIVEPVEREISASPGDCVGLEPDAIWSGEHLRSRIADAYAGRPNQFVESLRLQIP